MNSADKLAQEILLLTQALVVASTDLNDLNEFERIRVERDLLIAQLESEALELTDEVKTRANLSHAREINNQMMEQFNKAQQSLLDKKSELKRGARMQQAYNQNKTF